MGIVYLVGAGPGAPDLLTVRAVRLLGEADIVFHDALIGPEILSLAPQAEKVAVGKRCGRHSTAQQFINKRLVDAARRVPAKVDAERALYLNDIAAVRLSLFAPLFVDRYDAVRVTGSVILIDEATNQTVAAGLVQ